MIDLLQMMVLPMGPYLTGAVLQVTMLIGYLVSTPLSVRIGRRVQYFLSGTIAALAMFAIGYFLSSKVVL